MDSVGGRLGRGFGRLVGEADLQDVEWLVARLEDGGRDAGQVGRLGHRLGHGRDAGRVGLGQQPLEERVHLGLERLDGPGDALPARLDDGGMGVDLAIEDALASGDPGFGLFADARDLGLGPVADRGDVVVGAAAQAGRLDRGGRLDLLDGDLRIGDEARHGLVARGLGGGLHRLAQVGHELRRPAGRSGCRRVDHVRPHRLLG